MSLKYYAGKAMPGSEKRAEELDYAALEKATDQCLIRGTFNVDMGDPVELGEPDSVADGYRLWKCQVATADMIARDAPPFDGWVLRIDGEDLPLHFVEVVSTVRLRTSLVKDKWPAFPVEIALKEK